MTVRGNCGWMAAAVVAMGVARAAAAEGADTGTILVHGAPAAAQAGGHMLAHGTSVPLRTLSTLDSRLSQPGDRFALEVTDDVVVDGLVAIPKGSQATGQVNSVRAKRGWGHGGLIEAGLVSVRANGSDVAIDGGMTHKGGAGGLGMAAFILLTPLPIVAIPLFGHLVTGHSAVVPTGTAMTGLTHTDFAFDASPQAVQTASLDVPVDAKAATDVKPAATIAPPAVVPPVAMTPAAMPPAVARAYAMAAEPVAYRPAPATTTVRRDPPRQIGHDDYRYPNPYDAAPAIITIHSWTSF